MKNISYLILILLFFQSCATLKENTAYKINREANEQVFALKGYQPIDPISLSYENNCFENIVSLFPNEATRVAIGKLTQDGSLAFGSNVVARKGESYTIIIDYIK